MSLSVTTDVFCDRCPRWLCGTQGRLRAEGREARRLAREAGWVHRDGLDLCSTCARADASPAEGNPDE